MLNMLMYLFVCLNVNALKSGVVFPDSVMCVWDPRTARRRRADIQYIRCYIKQCSINLPPSVTLFYVLCANYTANDSKVG